MHITKQCLSEEKDRVVWIICFVTSNMVINYKFLLSGAYDGGVNQMETVTMKQLQYKILNTTGV